MSETAQNRIVQLIETEDGSNSLYVPDLNETYHSFHGALRESRHVFIKEGLAYWHAATGKSAANILEVGFGTGLNAILTAEYALSQQINIAYDSLEAYPLEAAIISQLNYPDLLQDEALKKQFSALHASAWDKPIMINPLFTLHKMHQKAEDFEPEAQHYDILFFDAFAPNKQAALWTTTILEKCYKSLGTGGVFVTYCAKGQLKRDLKSIGFEVQTLAGPPGKKEMVRAIKS